MKYKRGCRKPLPAGQRYPDQRDEVAYIPYPWFGTLLLLLAICAMVAVSLRAA